VWRRRLFNLAAAVSLVLCVATVALAVASAYYGFSLYRVSTRTTSPQAFIFGVTVLDADYGRIRLYHTTVNLHEIRHDWTDGVRWELKRSDPVPWGAGSGWRAFLLRGESDQGAGTSALDVVVPLWCLVVIFAVLPAVRIAQWRKARTMRKRREMECCPTCGYDLRATPDRCPECGTAVTPRVGAA
jgi:hypothetical protein